MSADAAVWSLPGRARVLVLTSLLAGCGAAGAGSPIRAALSVDVAAALAALRDPASDGGADITVGEALAFAGTVEGYDADEAVRGVVVAGRLRGEGAFALDAAYAAVVGALRHRVAGLAMTVRQAPGTTFHFDPAARTLEVRFDPAGVGYLAVEVVLTTDAWATASWRTLAPCAGGFGATFSGLPPGQRVEYALHVVGLDGRDFWSNNGRDLGVYAGRLALDHSFELAAAARVQAAPSAPAWVTLLRAFTDAASPAGATISWDEMSLLVEELTWEGGYGVHEPDVIVPLDRELDRLADAGADFAPGVRERMHDLLAAQLATFHWASYPSAAYRRTATGSLQMIVGEPGARAARLIYSTDGWNSPKVVDCAPDGGTGAPVCDLGAIPPGTLTAFTLELFTADGGSRWIRVLGDRNFFGPL